MAILDLSACSFKYPGADRWVIRDLNMRIRHGELIRIIGRNGSGKTTLLKLCAGLLTPTQGQMESAADNIPVYMEQDSSDMVAHGLTVEDHFRAFADPMRQENPMDPMAMLKDFGLDLELRGTEFVGHLSGGQRQIVALLTVLQKGANLLCLDEFVSALDATSAAVACGIVNAAVAKRKLSVLFVSHLDTELEVDREVELG